MRAATTRCHEAHGFFRHAGGAAQGIYHLECLSLSKRHSRFLPLVGVLLLVALGLVGCSDIAQRGIAQGWAGGVVADGTAFLGSMEGKIIAMDARDGTFRGEPVLLEAQLPSGGLFGCAPGGGTSAVAVYGSPAVEDDLVYVGGYDGKVYAHVFEGNRLRQQPRWVFPPQGSVGGPIVGGVIVANGIVYFGSANGLVYAVDAADGFELWSYPVGAKMWATPAITGDTVLIGAFDKRLYALDASDGSQKWVFETDGTLTSTPAIADGAAYFGSFDRTLYAVDIATGELLWQFPSPGAGDRRPSSWYWTTPVVVNGVVYAPNLDGKVYARDAGTGASVSEYDLGSPISAAPVVVDDTIILATSTTDRSQRWGALHAVNTATNQVKLLQEFEENIYAPLFTDGSSVYVHTMSDNLYAMDVSSGAVRKFVLASDD